MSDITTSVNQNRTSIKDLLEYPIPDILERAGTPMALSWLFFWTTKTPTDNAWHPQPGANPIQHISNLPPWFKRLDPEATAVDVAPFICGAGGLAHISQLNDFGFTAHASIFRNTRTLTVMHRTTLVLVPLVLVCQAVGLEYRDYIPRWAHERERRRDEEEVRRHVDVGMAGGAVVWALRLYALRWGKAFWAPVDVVMGGALTDLAHREYIKAHGF